MKPGLRKGVRVEHLTKVRSWMRPHLDGLVRHPLYSTWAMAYHCEVAARKLLAPFLDPDEEAVGAGLVLEHLAPAPVGGSIRVVCILSRMNRNRIYTHLDVYWKNRKIGRGSHAQVVMPRRRFEALIHGTKEWPHGHSPN